MTDRQTDSMWETFSLILKFKNLLTEGKTKTQALLPPILAGPSTKSLSKSQGIQCTVFRNPIVKNLKNPGTFI